MNSDKAVIKNAIFRRFMAEFLGTFVLISFGLGSWAQYVFLNKEGNNSPYLTVNWAWGLAVAMGMWVCNGVSGGHLNPAVSLAAACVGKLSWLHLPVYICAQYLAALAASGVVYGVYFDALNAHDGGIRQVYGSLATAQIWATYPASYLSWWNGFVDQIVATFLFVICFFAAQHHVNSGIPKGLVPMAVGMAMAVIGMAFGINCMYAINPARDLMPRVFTLMAGWGTETFIYGTFNIVKYNWFWVPVVGPHIGAILGAFFYVGLVGAHMPPAEDEPDPQEERMRRLTQIYAPHPVPDYDSKKDPGHTNEAFYMQHSNASIDTASYTPESASYTPSHDSVNPATEPNFSPM